MERQLLLERVAEWKLDARNEDMAKLFYQTKQFSSVQENETFIVVGRKGSGKTALGDRLISSFGNKRSLKLSLKDFPLQKFEKFKDKEFLDSSQYVPIWRYAILSSICWLMSHDPNIDYKTRKDLKPFFKADLRAGLGRILSEWTSSDFGLSVLGLGGNLKRNKNDLREMSWQESGNILENFIRESCKNANYLIVFDELDEHYPALMSSYGAESGKILAGLIKCCYGIRSSLISKHVAAVVLVRDDIYDAIQDPDKNKWSDFETQLTWSIGQLYELIAHRISVISESKPDPREVDTLFAHIVRKSFMRSGAIISPFESIMEQTQQRPRDAIKFLQLASEQAAQRHLDQIDASSLFQAETRYSTYLFRELKDETFQVLPNLDKAIELFSQQSRASLPYQSFMAGIRKTCHDTTEAERVVKLLIYYSIVGLSTEFQTRVVFHYNEPGLSPRPGGSVVLHFGLWRAAGITK